MFDGIISALDKGFRYTGRWHLEGTDKRKECVAITINSGSIVEFIFPGTQCELLFDVTGMTHFPMLMVQMDEGPITRYRLSADQPSITLHVKNLPENAAGHQGYWHLIRCWTVITSADAAQWQTLNGACKFLGVRCFSSETKLPELPSVTSSVEFLGDSITTSLRLLYDGHDGWDSRDQKTGAIHEWESIQDHQHPVLNWPWQLARLLNMAPIITGFGGQGLTTTGTIGAPPAVEAFPYVYADTLWKPKIPPRVVVIYQGSNDQEITVELYRTFLKTVRAAYPHAAILAVCPHTRPTFAPIIQQAAGETEPPVRFADCSQSVIEPDDTSEGVHLNPSGALRLAVRLAREVKILLREES